MTFKIVLTDQVFPDTDTEREILSSVGGELHILADGSPQELRTTAVDADAIITTYSAIDAETIGSLRSCKIISRYGIGVDNIDLEAAKDSGIMVTNVPDYCVEEVADHTLALILALKRKVMPGHRSVLEGGWGISAVQPLHRLRGRVLGLIGFGNIGRAVAARALAFGMLVTVFDPFLSDKDLQEGVSLETELDRLLNESDAVSIHAPLNEGTKGLVGALTISKMKQGSVLVNTSRGGIVDTAAVVEALRTGHLGGAGLDVFEQEPPDIEGLPEVPNLIATPHTAFYSEEAIKESQTKAAYAVVAALKGEEPRYRIV